MSPNGDITPDGKWRWVGDSWVANTPDLDEETDSDSALGSSRSAESASVVAEQPLGPTWEPLVDGNQVPDSEAAPVGKTDPVSGGLTDGELVSASESQGALQRPLIWVGLATAIALAGLVVLALVFRSPANETVATPPTPVTDPTSPPVEESTDVDGPTTDSSELTDREWRRIASSREGANSAEGREVTIYGQIYKEPSNDSQVLIDGTVTEERKYPADSFAGYRTGLNDLTRGERDDLRTYDVLRVTGKIDGAWWYTERKNGPKRWYPSINVTDYEVVRHDAAPPPARPAKPKFKEVSAATWSLVTRDPDLMAGKRLIVYARIIQADAVTGATSFLGDASNRADNLWSGGTAVAWFDEAYGLGALGEGDTVKVKAVLQGSYDYTTRMGGSNTVPYFVVKSVSRY